MMAFNRVDRDEEERLMTILYVVGNGFDRHHKMATSYVDFGEFLSRNQREVRTLLDDYFPTYDEHFWHHFEEELAHFDVEMLVQNLEHFIVPYSADDWSDAYHHDYEYELDRVVEGLSEGLLSAFTEWVGQIALPSPYSLAVPQARIDPTARFINFNYTRTLQELYRVPDDRIWHIHGVAGGTEPLVLGHAWLPSTTETQYAQLDLERDDTRFIGGALIIDEYFKKTFKPTAKIIAENAARFASFHDVDDIRVLGHSLSDVDLPYLQAIASNVGPNAAWRISFRGEPTAVQQQFLKIASAKRATFWSSLPEV